MTKIEAFFCVEVHLLKKINLQKLKNYDLVNHFQVEKKKLNGINTNSEFI